MNENDRTTLPKRRKEVDALLDPYLVGWQSGLLYFELSRKSR